MRVPSNCRSFCIMAWIRSSSGFSVTAVLCWFLLPLGRPGWPFLAFFLSFAVFLAVFLSRVAVFSTSLRTICSTIIGYECRFWVLIRDKVKKESPGTGLPYNDEKKRSNPYVFFPDFVTIHSSPAEMYLS